MVAFVDFIDHEIKWLMVAPEVQSQGLGTALVEAALAKMGGDGAQVLCVTRNEDAQRFYERIGFVRMGERRSGRMFGIPFENDVMVLRRSS